MALIDRTVYPRFPVTFDARELNTLYTPSQAEISFARKTVRGDSTILNFLAMLKTFQTLKYFPHPVEIPLAVTRHIHKCLALTEIAFTAYPPRSLYRHQPVIRQYLGFAAFADNKAAKHIVNKAVFEAAQTRDDPVDLINVAVEALINSGFELPAFSTLERLARRVRSLVNNGYFQKVLAALSQSHREKLDQLLAVVKPKRFSLFNQLKEPAQSATLTHFKDLQNRLNWLQELGEVESWLAPLPKAKIQQFAAQAFALDASDLKDYLSAKRYTLLASLIYQSRVTTRDNLVEMFIKRMATMHKQGQDELELLRDGQRGLNENILTAFSELLELAGANNKGVESDDEDDDEDEAEEELTGLKDKAQSKGPPVNTTQPQNQPGLAQATQRTALPGFDQGLEEVPSAAQADADAIFGRQVRKLLAENGGPDALLQACLSLSAYNGNNYLPLLPPFFKSHRATLFRLIRSLKIHSATHNQTLEKALTLILEQQSSRAKWLSDTLELDFANEGWQRAVRVRKKGRHKYRLNRRLLEICVFSYLAFELRTGDMYVEGSQDYADYRAELLSWQECQPLLGEYCQALELGPDAASFVNRLKEALSRTAQVVDAALPANESVSIDERGLPVLKKGKAKEVSATYGALLGAVHQKLNAAPHSLLQILANTEFWCKWTRHFGPLANTEVKLERPIEKYIFTSFAYGARLGPVQTAAHLGEVVSAQQLGFVNRSHITAARLEAASVDLINAYSRFSLPRIWGNEKVAIADGTKIALAENSLFSQRHFRYGHVGGIAYHHISDTYVALFTHFITCGIWEAVYIIDGLLKNKSLVQPDTLHADTQGQSTPVFGLSYLLGIKLMPRIRNWKDLIFFRPDKQTHYQHIDALFRETIDWSLLETHWPDLMRVVLSIKVGKILPSTLLRKLGNYSRKNKLYAAFQELGRVIRTIFLLEYLSDLALRQGVTSSTTKVERYNQFTDWITFGGEALLTVFEVEERDKRVKYTDLIANAVMLQNVADLTQVLKELKAEGLSFTREDVARLTPYQTRHIRRFGEYVLDLENKPNPLNEEEVNFTL